MPRPRVPHSYRLPVPGSALLTAWRQGYGLTELKRDLLAGLTIGIVAVPLSMALAIATGVPPQHGLYTAIVAGAIIALTGGSRFNISGPTAAFVVILFPIVASHGVGGLLIATLMAGLILVALGLARLGSLIQFVPYPVVGRRSTNGGYCGPAVKPIALHMVAALARDPRITVPISGIGGIANWRDAAEFIALGATSVQVCTAAMHYGFRIVEDMIDGLSSYLDEKGMKSVNELRGKALPAFTEWGDLDLNYKVVAHVDADKCIGCNLCYVACRDTAVNCIHNAGEPLRAGHLASTRDAALAAAKAKDAHIVWVDETECIGCNLCAAVCPVPECITMVDETNGRPFESWNDRIAKGTAKVPGGLDDYRAAHGIGTGGR